MEPRVIRVADLPGMRAFFDAVMALVDVINTEDVPSAVSAAADRVRAETLGIGQEPLVVASDDEKSPARLGNEERLRTAMHVAKENPLRAVNVDWIPE